jgi:hypothetical protein
LRDFGGTAFPEQEQTDLVCGKEPYVSILTVRSPTGFIGMLSLREAVLFNQFRDDGSKQMSQAMKAFYEGSRINL